MRHKVHAHRFGRKTSAREAMFKGLVVSLVEHGRIQTTLAKAKELRRHVERAITLGKNGDASSRRILVSRYGSEKAVETLMKDVCVRFKSREGGYTRILKVGLRAGDMAPMALIEFVDYKLPEVAKAGETTVKGDAGAVKRAKAKAKVNAAKRKAKRAIQAKSRRANRRK